MNLKKTFPIPNFGFRISSGQRRRSRAGAQKNSSLEIHNSKFARAFTLVEIMVAIAIFGIIIAAIYSTWTLILRASQAGQSTAARAQRQRIALRTIEDSLTCVQSFQASRKYYSFVAQNGDQPILSFTARLPDVFPRNGKFGGLALRRLIFSVEPGPGSEKDLVLRQNPVLMDMDPDELQTPLVLTRDVKKFTVECWDAKTMDWVDEWDTTNTIPAVVRISFTLGGNADAGNAAPELAVTRFIAIPSSTLPAGLQTRH
ncbi:MAG: prepilin-type N-terminal cleavage/methylation domain-containing protein [Verrucomicrobiota bacterium]|jgi:prepilin-type N-terminal cleavage/methylation domain-containing protein